jgi:uncharacterized protein
MKVPVGAGGVVLVVATLAAAAGPVATCAGARPRSIEALICGSPLLTALEAETARLYRLATGPREPVVAIGAKQAQRDWLLERNRCFKVATRETCVRDRHLARIAGLRVASRAAREDDRGISRGPFAFRCEHTDGLLTVIFVNSEPAFASISHRGQRQTLQRAPAASGARYEGADERAFWEHQGEATYRVGAAAPEVRCVPEAIG